MDSVNKNSAPILIRYGKVIDTHGVAARSGEIQFVPADVRLEGNGFNSNYGLGEYVSNQCPPILRRPHDEHFDAAWVRARFPRIFGFTPDPSKGEKSLLGEGMVAVFPVDRAAYPFICSDGYGRTALMFSPNGPEAAIQIEIAEKFWRLLLSEPDDVADFSTKVFHPGGGFWMEFGCDNGEPYYREHASGEDNGV